jgi:hypothetical protein
MRTSRFFASFLITLVTLVLAGFLIARTGYYIKHTAYFYHVPIDVKFNATKIDADVLLVGDSALLNGVDPAVITSDTHLTSYNLGIPVSAFMYDPYSLPDTYLKQNAKPQLIVLYVSPTARPSDPDPHFSCYDAGIMFLRYCRLSRTVGFFAALPARIPSFALTVYDFLIWHFDRSGQFFADQSASLIAERGYSPNRGPSDDHLTLATCKSASSNPGPLDAAFYREFRERYEARGIPVAIYLAPFADCDPRFDFYAKHAKGLTDNEVGQLPYALFAHDAVREHLLDSGATLNSHIVARFIEQYRAKRKGLMTASVANPG